MWQDFMSRFGTSQPEKIALIDRTRDRTWRYDAMAAEILRRAGQLATAGVQEGDRVVYIAPNRLEHLTLLFACIRLGAILVPLNPRLAPEEITAILDDVEPRLLLGSHPLPHPAWQELDTLPHAPTPPPEQPRPASQVMLILYTSGSTGAPKGVMLHAGMLMANMAHTVAADVLRPEDVTVVNTPFFHTGGYNVFTLPLWSIGGTLILHERFDPGLVLREVRETGMTVFWAVPTMFQAIFSHPDFHRTDFGAIRFLLSGGAPLPLGLILGYHQRGIPFKQGFGLTEVGPNCFLLETQDAPNHPDSIGRPMAHSRVRVVNASSQDVAPGEVGELWIGGPHVCAGYWRQQELFERSMGDGLFRTGDLVRVDAEGFFHVVGRMKEMYISGGENVYPGEVEKPLNRHPEVEQAVVVGVPDPRWSEVGLAFYVGRRALTLAEIRNFLDPLLARFKHPHHLVRLEAMPLLANGKVDRPALKRMAREHIAG